MSSHSGMLVDTSRKATNLLWAAAWAGSRLTGATSGSSVEVTAMRSAVSTPVAGRVHDHEARAGSPGRTEASVTAGPRARQSGPGGSVAGKPAQKPPGRAG